MRRFEFVEGSSSKFWQIVQTGTQLFVTWGRIGTDGQTQIKTFDDTAKAAKEHDKLIAEKVKKGYVEAGAAPAPKVPVPAPVPVPVPVPVPAPAPVPAPSAAPYDDAVEDQVFWTPALRRRVFVRRGGAEARTLPPVKKAWADLQAAWRIRQDDVSAGLAARGPHHETLAKVRSRVMSDTPVVGTVAEDAALIAVLAYKPTWNDAPEFDAPIAVFAAVGGLAHAVAATVTALGWSFVRPERNAVPVLREEPDADWATSFHQRGNLRGMARLRALLAGAPEAEYLAARDVAAGLRRSDASRAATTFLFPTERAWVAMDLKLASKFVCVLASVDLPGFLTGLASTTLYGGRWGTGTQDVAATLVDALGTAAAPFLLANPPSYDDADMRRSQLDLWAAVGTDTMAEGVAAQLEHRDAQAAFADVVANQPARALRVLAGLASQRGKAGDPARALLELLVRKHPAVVDARVGALPPEHQRVVLTLRGSVGTNKPDAAPEALPPVLRVPPWASGKKRAGPPVLADVVVPAPEPRMAWLPGEREKGLTASGWNAPEVADWAALARSSQVPTVGMLALCPSLLVPTLAARATTREWADQAWFPRVVAEHGLIALPFYLARLAEEPKYLGEVVPVGHAALAPLVAEAYARKKSLRDAAKTWLLRNPGHAAAGLLPLALGKAGKPRDDAALALRFLAQTRRDDVLVVADAAGIGDAARAVLDLDPLDLYPAKLPKRPDWLDVAVLPRPLLRDRSAALPVEALDAILTMLQFSTPDAPYAGLAMVREATDPASLGRFAWALFQTWLLNGAPGKEGWCMAALASIGDDACARQLEKLIRLWPGEGGHQRAVAGLDVLATLGSDVALMLLNGIALKSKFKGLQAQAQEKIALIAEARGLTREELEDRLAPDLGLDDDGSMVLDFGPRTFTVGFDEELRPFVKDAAGARLKDLPKPNKSDDAEKGAEASARWGLLKKDAKQAARLQIMRLELAMCGKRRFDGAAFVQLFVEHPLVFHIVRRLVWATYTDGAVSGTFRVAEDRSMADASDDAWALPEGATVGIPHPLELDADTLSGWSQVFADYALLQPFAQLGRPTYAPTLPERGALALNRWPTLAIPTGKVLGLEARGWRRGPAQDGGVACWMEKPLPNGKVAMLDLDPGLYTGSLADSPEQKLGDVTVGDPDRWNARGDVRFGDLDPIVFSEIVKDLEGLR